MRQPIDDGALSDMSEPLGRVGSVANGCSQRLSAATETTSDPVGCASFSQHCAMPVGGWVGADENPKRPGRLRPVRGYCTDEKPVRCCSMLWPVSLRHWSSPQRS